MSEKLSEFTLMRGLIEDMLSERRSERRRRWVMGLLFFGGPVLLGILYWMSIFTPFSQLTGFGQPVVGVVRIQGEISSSGLASADKVIPALRKVFESKQVKAVVLSIDSPGGAPLESERIYRAMIALKDQHPKPVVAVINNIGASAAYMVAIHADKIYAGQYSLVGSVGAVLSSWDVHKALEKYDVAQGVYASGKLKSMLNPFIPVSNEASIKAQQMVDGFGQQFLEDLNTNRGDKLMQNVAYGTGEVWSGKEALKLGLIDGLATIDEVAETQYKLQTQDFGPTAGLPFAKLMTEVSAQAIQSLVSQANSAAMK